MIGRIKGAVAIINRDFLHGTIRATAWSVRGKQGIRTAGRWLGFETASIRLDYEWISGQVKYFNLDDMWDIFTWF
jgi:hypothetical protein